MTLETLATKLESAKTGTDIEQVIFDFADYLNTDRGKVYPVVLWNLTGIKGIADLREGSRELEVDVFCIIGVTPEDDVKLSRLQNWDDCETYLQAYLDEVNDQDDLSIPDLNNVEFEYYPAGLLSVDRELGVRYRVTLKLWC